MNFSTGLTNKDKGWIDAKCRSIATLERYGLAENQLRREIYLLGLFAFRQFHKAGPPMDLMNPGLNHEHTTANKGIHH